MHPTVTQGFKGRRLGRVALRAPRVTSAVKGGALAVDGARQWLHVGSGKAVLTYHAASGEPLCASADYNIDGWRGLRTDRRRGDLLMLAQSGGDHVVYRSADGGMTGMEVARVATTKALIERDSERGKAILLTQDGDGTADGAVSVRRSDDGGATWGAATACALVAPDMSSAPLVATLIDVSQDPRRAAVSLACTVGGGTLVLESRDVGGQWVTKATVA